MQIFIYYFRLIYRFLLELFLEFNLIQTKIKEKKKFETQTKINIFINFLRINFKVNS